MTVVASVGLIVSACASRTAHPATSSGTSSSSATATSTMATSATTGATPSSSCSPPPGGRCEGPATLAGARIEVSPDGRTLTFVSTCGGSLTATRDASRVTLTYRATSVEAGRLMCARVPLSTTLAEPLGATPVFDSVSGARLDTVPAG